MPTLNAAQLADYNYRAGFRGDFLRNITAIELAESSGQTDVINNTAFPALAGYRPPARGNAPEYSIGIAQINSIAHFPGSGERNFMEYVSKLFDPAYNAREAYRIASNGTYLGPWSTWDSGRGSYKAHLGVVDKALSLPMDAARGAGGAIADAAGGIGGAIGGAVSGPVKAVVDPIKGVAGAILDSRTWWRVLFVVGGILVIGLGLVLLNKDSIASTVKAAV